MNTIIFKWNPSFSSYSMVRNLQGIVSANIEGEMIMDWSAREWQNMQPGDRWYMVKVGYGGTGIVAAGTLIGKPYRGEDWSGRGREVYYVDMDVEIWLNPDAVPILSARALTARIPEFDWDRGSSGVILPASTADKVNALWSSFIDQNREILQDKARSSARYNDKIYWKKEHS